MYSSRVQIPLSYGTIFEDNAYRHSAIPANLIGMPKRAEQFQNVFESPINVQMQHGGWERKFTNASRKANPMIQRQRQLQPPRAVMTPRRLSTDIMANYSHGLDNTLVIGPTKFNMNTNLLGQPNVPLDPRRMCPINASSRGQLGRIVR